jgi:23S rRNA (cytosine1962-C5)-methyltransferase
MLKKAILKKGKEEAIARKHPWIFSGAIQSIDPCTSGEIIEIYDYRNRFCAIGYSGTGSIALRILTFQNQAIDRAFWVQKLQKSYQLRQSLGLGLTCATNAYRLVHGEGDGLPGLIIDIYEKNAVIQAHTDGIFEQLESISGALQEIMGTSLERIYSKSKSAMHDQEVEDFYLLGSHGTAWATENHLKFHIDWEHGQKTGFFLDQRENRHLLRHYAPQKTVLNTFSYSGGFSVAALAGGASNVTSVDISQHAIYLAHENIVANGYESQHTGICADVLHYLTESEETYDIVVLDPPAFAKSLKKKHAATMGYKRLNALGFNRVAPGGLLFTFSCSQVIDTELFEHTVRAAAIESGREAQIVHRLSQGPDHPVNIFHPEGHYLKGLVLRVY